MPGGRRIFELAGGALMQRRRIEMTDGLLHPRPQGQAQAHRVTAAAVHYRNTWYLDASTTGAIRNGAMLKGKPKDAAIGAVEAELDGGYGVFAGPRQKSQWVKLRFAPEPAQWVQHEQWHRAQEAKVEDDGPLTLRVPYASVLRHGELVRVVGPVPLAAVVAMRLRATVGGYL